MDALGVTRLARALLEAAEALPPGEHLVVRFIRGDVIITHTKTDEEDIALWKRARNDPTVRVD